MTRWWSSPDQGAAVLASVDDSDVVQGVGTALLGYHALTQGVLRPLSTRTLVDVAKVSAALDEVDLEPVAKALAEATRPVLGDASGKYGILRAAEMHSSAKEATERLILSWTQTGMPWPHAVERAAEVHGVPINRLGRYATQMKGPVTPLVRQDMADRMLMEYASELGRLESTEVEGIAKASRNRDFDPQEHPRGTGGRFRRKGEDPEAVERQQRRERRLGRMRRIGEITQERKQSVEAARESAKQQVNALMSLFLRPEPAERQESTRTSVGRTEVGRTSAARVDVAGERVEVAEAAPEVRSETRDEETRPPMPEPARERPEFTHRQQGESFFVLSRWEFSGIEGDEFDPGAGSFPAYSKEQLDSILSQVNPEDVVLVRVRDVPITGDEEDSRKGKTVPKGVKYDLRSHTEWVYPWEKATAYGEISIDFTVLDLSEITEVRKDLTGPELDRFNRQRRRDQNGRFADKPDVPDWYSRQARRARRLNRLQRRQVVAEEQKTQQTMSVADQVKALLALNAEFDRSPKAVERLEDTRTDARGRLVRRDADRQEVDLDQKAEDKRDPFEDARGRTEHVKDFLNKEVVFVDDDDFTMLNGATPGEYVRAEKPTVGYMTGGIELGFKPKFVKMGAALEKVSRPQGSNNVSRSVFTSYEQASEEGARQERWARENGGNVQYEVEEVPSETPGESPVFRVILHDYSRAKKMNILQFEDAEAKRAYLRGDLVSFETIAQDDLEELLHANDIDPYDPNLPNYSNLQGNSLRPPITAFIIRLPRKS